MKQLAVAACRHRRGARWCRQDLSHVFRGESHRIAGAAYPILAYEAVSQNEQYLLLMLTRDGRFDDDAAHAYLAQRRAAVRVRDAIASGAVLCLFALSMFGVVLLFM